MELFYDEIDTPIGTLLLLKNEDKLIRVSFGNWDDLAEEQMKWVKRYVDNNSNITHAPIKFSSIKMELDRYFMGKQQYFSIPFEINGTPFQKRVWTTLNEIPFGQTKTYRNIAISIGNPKAVRAVGTAIGKNPLPIIVPCHRVIGVNGKLVGYNGGIDRKRALLELEDSSF